MSTCLIFQNCTLNSIAEELPEGQHSITGAITAQGRRFPDNNTGFSFVGCTIQGSGSILLGRAWQAYSRVVFAYTYMPAIVASAGWDNWGQESRNRFLLSIHFRERLCFQLSCNSISIVLTCLCMDSRPAPSSTASTDVAETARTWREGWRMPGSAGARGAGRGHGPLTI